MYEVREGTDTYVARPRPIGSVVPACAAARPRHAFAAGPWHGSLIATMPSLGEDHGSGLKSILANGTRRLKEPST
jgi:hypothetical protein